MAGGKEETKTYIGSDWSHQRPRHRYQLGGWLTPAAPLVLLEYKASLAPTEIGARDADAVMPTAMVPFGAEVKG